MMIDEETIQNIKEGLNIIAERLSEILLKEIDKIHDVLCKFFDSLVTDYERVLKCSDSNEEKVRPYIPVIKYFILRYRVLYRFKIPLSNRLAVGRDINFIVL